MSQNVKLSTLFVLNSLDRDPILSFLEWDADDAEVQAECAAELIRAAENLGLSGNLLPRYLLHVLTHEANLVSETMERTGLPPGGSLRQAFYQDIERLYPLLTQPTSTFLGAKLLDHYEPTQNVYDKTEDFLLPWIEAALTPRDYAEALLTYYARYGYGELAGHVVFRWDDAANKIRGIAHFERTQMKNLIGYQRQKEQLLQNTRAFVQGKPANHVLLVGARGTGKSSLVKALLHEYAEQGLRLIEVDKHDLATLPVLLVLLEHRPEKFIVFCDDLSFEEGEDGYKALKTALDGSLSRRADNVLVYATSNRRHLIPEYMDENGGTTGIRGEIHQKEAVEEKISLSDRFGLWLSFYPFDQNDYLTAVANWLDDFNVPFDDTARQASLQWAQMRGSRSGRSAWQFACDWAGRLPEERVLD